MVREAIWGVVFIISAAWPRLGRGQGKELANGGCVWGGGARGFR